jgi:hypothetical protein
MITLRQFSSILSLIAIPFLSFSQSYWEAGLGLGTTNYLGDMVEPVFTFSGTHFAAQANMTRIFDAKHAIGFNVLYGKLSGDDNQYESLLGRGASFQTTLVEVSFKGILDLRGQKRFNKKGEFNKTFSPYIFVGLAVAFAKPEVVYQVPNNEDAFIDYPGIHIAAPIGGGVKYDLNETIFVGLEVGTRFTASDYIDGVQASGNAYKNDVYFFGGLTAGYRLVKKKEEVKVENM